MIQLLLRQTKTLLNSNCLIGKPFPIITPKNSVKIIKENGIVTQKEVIGEVQNFNYVEKINFNWKLSNESQKIENYNTQKATTDFGGRKWNAWFTTEIPINDTI
jgi:GLPGLI family protein